MSGTRATRCCRVIAILAIAIATLTTVAARDRTVPPLALFPIRSVWTLALNRALAIAPAYSGTHAYFALTGGSLVAYDLTTGHQEWQLQIRPELELAAGGGLLFIVDHEGLSAVHGSDGSVAWKMALPATLAATPAWDNGWLVLAFANGDVQALRAADGTSIWHRSLMSRARTSPSLAADRVYVALDDQRVVALRIEDGEPIWERRLGGPPTGLLATEDRVFAGSADNFFYAINTGDGTVDWRWRTGADLVGSPIIDEHNVYFVSLDNVLRALSRKTGGQQWFRPLPIRPNRGPIAVGSVIVVSGVAPTLRAYQTSDGKPAGQYPANGELAGPVYAIPGVTVPELLVVTRDLARGASATLIARMIEPPITQLGALPNPIPLTGRGAGPVIPPPVARPGTANAPQAPAAPTTSPDGSAIPAQPPAPVPPRREERGERNRR